MALKGQFEQLDFDLIEGYRIAAYMTPHQGIQGSFYVDIWDRIDAHDAFDKPVELGDDGRSPRGDLKIADDERTYVFQNIDLSAVTAGSNRRERFRHLEFRYDTNLLRNQNAPVDLSNNSQDELRKGALDEDYMYSLDDSSEHLLGFEARLAPQDACVFRFSALRNGGNSFLQKMLELNNKRALGERMPDFTIKLSQGPLDVKQENLLRMFVEETYGTLRDYSPVSLGQLMRMDVQADQIRLNRPSPSPTDLLKIESQNEYARPQLAPQTIETATLVFHPGHYRNFPIT